MSEIIDERNTHEDHSMSERILNALDDLSRRFTRIETLVELHLGKDGTVDRLETQVNSINTRVLLISGGIAVIASLFQHGFDFLRK